MPIVDISGLTIEEADMKAVIREQLKKYFAKKLNTSEDSTTVTFITDETTDTKEHVMARLYSKSFVTFDRPGLESMCNDIIEILEIADHPFNEVFPIPVMAMYGRRNAIYHHGGG
ncbi:MAG: hypothetical protein ACKUBY_00075 [Candidatus Moraniibacteriota bacterium]|jgi:hypothetical protein